MHRRIGLLAILGALSVAPAAMAQPYGYGGPPPSARNWHAARRAESVARQRAAHGDFSGAVRAHRFAERRRSEAHRLRREGY